MRSYYLFLLPLVALVPGTVTSQTKMPVQQAIEAQYPLTKPTADHKDMVTAGAVIDLLKDNLEMNEVTASTECKDTYKGGKFEPAMMCKLAKNKTFLGHDFSEGKAGANRTFVAGEKFWLIKVDVQDKAVVLEFLSDPISDVRYRALVAYPFPSRGFPTPEVVLAAIKETVKAEPVEGKEAAAQPNAPVAPVAPAPAPTKYADFAPPPPPADAPPVAPPTIKLGMTKDQVVALFGQPTNQASLPTKEIYSYPGMKVIFVKGKVSDVQ